MSTPAIDIPRPILSIKVPIEVGVQTADILSGRLIKTREIGNGTRALPRIPSPIRPVPHVITPTFGVPEALANVG